MHHSNMLKLADAVEQMGMRFNMEEYWSEGLTTSSYKKLIKQSHNNLPPCGTTCCIAGEAMILWKQPNLIKVRKNILELSFNQWTFMANGYWSDEENIEDNNNPYDAAQAIRKMVKDDQESI